MSEIRRRSWLIMIVVGGGLVALPAEACRAYRAPEDKVRANFDAVAIGVIEKPRLDTNDTYDGRGWWATLRVTNSVEGRPSDQTFMIGRTGDGAACDDGEPLPKEGDRWVVYLSRRSGSTSGMYPALSYPLNLARRIDARLR